MNAGGPEHRASWIGLAAAAYEAPDRIQAELTSQAAVIGPWRVVWQAQSHDGANLVYVARHLEEDLLALVIRGSLVHPLDRGFWTDWAREDLDILHQVPVPFGRHDDARIAAGMRLACDHIMSMSSEGLSLKAFLLGELRAGQDRLWITGHSLGGALVPILACWFRDVLFEENATDTDFMTPVSFAGPTPGNAAFAKLVEAQFGGFPYRFVNELDMVPHTWTPEGLRWIMRSYRPRPKIPHWFRFTCVIVRGWMWWRRFRYAQPGPGMTLPGQLDGAKEWFAEVAHQHSIDTYHSLLVPRSQDDAG